MTSQHEIEKYVRHFFPKPGIALEIGCWHGELISQTADLEKDGWQCICVDPFPSGFENRKTIPFRYALAQEAEERVFVKVSIDRRYGGDVSYFSGFKDSIQAHWPLISEHCDYEEIKIITKPVREFFKYLPNYIHFLSVDTEGSEQEIFESIDFNKFSFGLIVFEHNESREAREAVSKVLEENGYVLYKHLRVDSIFVNKNLL